jgi:hypothetical protein
MVPGFGRVAGAGTLVAGLKATTGDSGAELGLGGVAGYLIDQGMPVHTAKRLEQHVRETGPLLAVVVSANTSGLDVIETLRRYNASLVEMR